MTETFEKIFIGSLFAALFALLVFALFFDKSNKKIELNSKEWVCLKSELHQVTTFIPSGKAIIPIFNTYSECIMYGKR